MYRSQTKYILFFICGIAEYGKWLIIMASFPFSGMKKSVHVRGLKDGASKEDNYGEFLVLIVELGFTNNSGPALSIFSPWWYRPGWKTNEEKLNTHF